MLPPWRLGIVAEATAFLRSELTPTRRRLLPRSNDRDMEKRYLPNGLVSLLQSIEASVARRPLGLQLAGGSGASHRFERTARRVSLVSLALHEVVHHRSDPAGAPWDSILGHGCGGLRTFLCKSAE